MNFDFEGRFPPEHKEVSQTFLLGMPKLICATQNTNGVDELAAQLQSISLNNNEETKDYVKTISLKFLEPRQLNCFITFVEALETDNLQQSLISLEKFTDYLSLASEL